MVNILKYHKVSGRRAMTYPSIPSLIASVPYNKTLPVPNPPSNVICFYVLLTNTNLFFLRLDPISYTVCYVAYLLFIISNRNVLQ